MVPLKEVHESGGHAFTEDEKETYANDLIDPQHLIVVEDGANQSKSHKDPADWLPPNRAYWCQYLEDWVAVKQRFELAMDQAEEDAVSRGPDVCGLYRIRDHLDGRHDPEP